MATRWSAAICHSRAGIRVARAAVVEHDRRADEQAGRDDVPHDPVGRGVPEHRAVGPGVEVQAEELVVLEQHAAVTVHDALGQAGGAGREQHPQRRVEVDPVEAELGRRRGRRLPGDIVAGVVSVGLGRGRQADVGDVDGGPQRRQRPLQRRHLGAAVVHPAVPPVAVGGEQDHRLELGEPGGGAVGAVVLGAGRPDRADAGGGEERDQRRRGVGEVADHPVTALDAGVAEPLGERRDLGPELRPGRLAGGPVLADGGDGHGVVVAGPAAQGVLGVVEPGAGKPARAGHGRADSASATAWLPSASTP